jgi:hypothetical protein
VDHYVSAGPAASISPGTGIAHTADGGRSWQAQLSVPTGIWGLDALGSQTAWAVGVTSLYETTNGGSTWTAVLQGEQGGDNIVNVAFATASDGTAVTARGALVHTTDGGATWSPVSSGSSAPVNVTDLCAERGAVVAVTADGAVWTNATGAAPSQWTSSYQPTTSASTVQNASMVSCGASGSTWEAVAPTNPQGSGGGLVIAQGGPTTPWATTTSAYSSQPQQRPRIVGSTNSGTSFPIRGVSWLPISGADHPIVVSTGGGGGPPQGIYVQIAAGRYQAATGTGPLFGATGPATVIYHGIAFGSGGSGWLYADVVPVPTSAFAPSSMPSSPASYQVVVCHTTDGGATWSTVTDETVS